MTHPIATNQNPKDYPRAAPAEDGRFHQFLEFSPGAMIVFDRTGRVTDLTPSFTRLFGYTIEDMSHVDDWWPLAYPDPGYREEQRLFWDALVANALAQNDLIHNAEGLVHCKDGHFIWVEAHASFSESAMFVLLVDISKRKQAQTEATRFASQAEADRKEAAWLNLALDATQSGVWEWLPETDTHYWSPAIWRLFGLDEHSQTPSFNLWEEIIHPEDRHRIVALIRESVSARKDFQGEYRLSAPRARWLHVHGSPVKLEVGEPVRYLGIVMEITGIKALETQLATTEERWSFALQGAGLGVWDWNIDNHEVYWSPDWLKMIGYQEGEIAPTAAVWAELLHPDDRARVFAYGANFIANPVGRYELEFRLRHKQGYWIDILSRATLARDSQGNPVVPQRLVGTHMDQSERKAIELSMKESSQRYEAMREGARDGFCVVNLEGRILEVNESYCRMSGYPRDELETLTISDLEITESREQTLAHIQRILEQGNDQFETRQRRKNGEIWHVEISASFSTVEGGRLFCFARDISARKRNQRMAELRQQLLELARLGDQNQILSAALDVAEELTYSRIGFLHFVEENQEHISLQVWSTRTLAEMCFAEGKGQHYPISEAGVWVDCIRQRQPVIHNDYAALPHRKGLPDGHALLTRIATAPLFLNNRIVAVIGVGNKACDYTGQDLQILTQVIELAFDFTERQKVEQMLEYIAYYDVLTGLPNRSLLTDRLNQAIAQCSRSNQLIAVCCLNLDGFKPVNDTYGYAVGDALLVNLARRLQENLRQGDSLARLAGDEFALLLTGLSSPYECEEAVQRILKQINDPVQAQVHQIHISATIGVTLFPMDHTGPDALLRHAHEAMYQAKSANKSSYQLYDLIQDQQLRQRRQIREDFILALQNNQLQLYYQPKINLRDGRVVGVEALIRWQHPRDGLLIPYQFLPLIENTPLEIALGEWVVGAALAQQQAWRESGVALSVSINISPRHIQMQGFADFLARTLAAYPVDTAGMLEIEVLEISEIGDTHNAAQVMNACKALGIHFALDDFGTGYSSLTYFHHLPIDVVKIDQHFVRDMLDKNEDLDIVEGVLRMAKALRRPVVAEGVESVEIGFMLLQLGCEFAQGFGIARPMPAQQIPQWLIEWEENHLWRGLRQESLVDSANYDFNVAIFSLRIWLEQVIAYLQGYAGREPPPLDESQCQFSRWYHGIGQARHGAHPHYAFIQTYHHQIHALATLLIDQAAAGQAQEAQARLVELEALNNELIRWLRSLASPQEARSAALP